MKVYVLVQPGYDPLALTFYDLVRAQLWGGRRIADWRHQSPTVMIYISGELIYESEVKGDEQDSPFRNRRKWT